MSIVGQPNPLVQVYDRLTAALVATVQATLYDADGLRIGGSSLANVRTAWRPVPDQLATIEKTITDLGTAILATVTDGDLTPDARDRRIVTISDTAWTKITSVSTSVLDTTAKILDDLRGLVYPTRPTPADAAQEAALTGLKQDVRMSLDPLDSGDDAVRRIGELLARALANNDALASWLLAASDWTTDYMTARRFDDRLDSLHRTVDQTIMTPSPDTAELISIFRTLSNPQAGLPVLDLLLNSTLAAIFNDLRSWRPTASQPTPSAVFR